MGKCSFLHRASWLQECSSRTHRLILCFESNLCFSQCPADPAKLVQCVVSAGILHAKNVDIVPNEKISGLVCSTCSSRRGQLAASQHGNAPRVCSSKLRVAGIMTSTRVCRVAGSEGRGDDARGEAGGAAGRRRRVRSRRRRRRRGGRQEQTAPAPDQGRKFIHSRDTARMSGNLKSVSSKFVLSQRCSR